MMQHNYDPFSLQVKSRNVEELSGGELQRFACAMVCIQKADIFMFDEPSSYLVSELDYLIHILHDLQRIHFLKDVKQRLNAAKAIRNLAEPGIAKLHLLITS